MITDEQTNFLYLSDLLPKEYPEFYAVFESALNKAAVPFEFLTGTADVWAVDYMPLQVEENRFVRFAYKPDYLVLEKKYHSLITDTDQVCSKLGIETIPSPLVIDDGNLVRSKDTLILCDKVFSENRERSKKEIENSLRELTGADKILWLPWDEHDIIGHADGMVRFIGDHTVMINETLKYNRNQNEKLRLILLAAGLDVVECPHYLPRTGSLLSAEGLYLNYLQMEQAVFVPQFGSEHDERAMRFFELVFYGRKVFGVMSNEIAKDSGVLNCVSWNVLSRIV